MQSRGVASSDVMADLQEVDPVPSVQEARWLAEYKALVTSMEQGQVFEERIQVLKFKIINHFGENHSVWLECQRLERLQKIKSRLGKSKLADRVNR